MKKTIAFIGTILLILAAGVGSVKADEMKKATFAGGCFWCMQPEFTNIPGVSSVVSGYTGGTTKNPTYEQVSHGNTGHVEAIEVTYDPAKVKYNQLLEIFWQNIDPLDQYGQFCDKGEQYRAGIYYHDDEQKKAAEASKEKVAGMFKEPIATVIKPASEFYAAEDYHQDYNIKNKTRYKMYRFGCGRDARLDKLWSGKKLAD
ncbi:MAG: peptide-methionine (S)-S-oxide reductase [Proteobacteria bacterium]|nr:peptide-methionine (S)-S-oxide reductase [Pseudomonadota bacterium]